ncbi:MAG: metallophosphoesterase [Gammaproteobacteria bacterium]
MNAPVRLIQLTDTHSSHHPEGEFYGIDTLASLRAVIDWLPHSAPFAAVVVSGDLVSEESARAYRSLHDHLARIDAPVYCMPGNHDDIDLLRAHVPGGNVRLDAALDLGGWRIVLLDTRVAGSSDGWLADAELARLDAALAGAAGRPALVFLHHQPVPIGSPWIDSMMVGNADALFAILARHRGVRALVCGHIHQELDTARDGIRVLGTPSTCAQFVPNHHRYEVEPRPPGYRWLDLHADGRLDTGVVRLPHPAPRVPGLPG